MDDWMRHEWQQLTEEKNFEIIIHSIENIVRQDDIAITCALEHNGIMMDVSDVILIKATIDEARPHTINFIVHLHVILKDKESLNSLISTPILIKITQNINNEDDARSTSTNVESKKKSIFSTKSVTLPTSKILGICNIDVMPLILGEQKFTEKIVLETPSFSFDETMVSWQNLPRLTVTIAQDFSPIFHPEEQINFLSITIESIYNPPEFFTDNLRYRAGTIAFIDSQTPTNIIFDYGIFTRNRDVERTKRWNSLRQLENRAQLSKYKLDCDFMSVKNDFKKQCDLAKMTCEDIPRIEWNSMNRCIIWEPGIDAMRDHIQKHKYWPIQFEISDTGNANVAKPKGIPSITSQLYQCYVDVSELIYPGRRSCRVIGQLYTYNPVEITEKLELEKNIFSLESPRKDSKEKDKKSRTSKQSNQSENETVLSTPITTKSGEPTIVVFEIELHKPLVACRIEKDFADLINTMIPQTKQKQHYVYSGDVAENQYIYCIQKLAEVLTECYRDFSNENEKKNTTESEPRKKYCFDPELDELTCFRQYLYKTGLYLTICNTLRTKIPMLIDQKFELPKNLVGSNKSHNIIASIYTYLVEQMHLAINKMVEGRFIQDVSDFDDSDKIYFYAEEAYEFGEFSKARTYYKKAIAKNKGDPYPWTQYAIFLHKIGDIDRAKECSLEAIKLDRQYAIALLVQAMVLFKQKQYREAEIFLNAIVDFHPHFFEGWAILHLFYIRTEYYPGVDLTSRIAEKCMQNKSHPITFDKETLAWTSIYCPQDNMYMRVATFLLKLNFCEFAGFALAEEMSNSIRSNHVLYYMAVEHYLSGRYEDALSHLNEIQCTYGIDHSVSSLMGHCYYKMGDTEKELECYEFARMLFDRPENLYLVEVRLGYHYYDVGDFDRAKRIFLSACNSSPTSLTWLGVGMSCYELEQYHDAEITLSEANRIDNRNPEIWGYLCLLNMTLGRYDEFAQCYAEMVKNNLKNKKLWLRIMNLMHTLNWLPPSFTETETSVEDHGSEGFEEHIEN